MTKGPLPIRQTWACAQAAAAIAVLTGCGAELSERTVSDRWSPVLLQELGGDWRSAPAAELARHQHRMQPGGPVTEPVLEPIVGSGTAPLRGASLLHVEIAVYPKASCADKSIPPDESTPRTKPKEAPVSFPIQGTPERTARIWMVAADTVGSRPFALGPPWLGNYLRLAGPGRTVLFPAYQDCAAMTESRPDQLPTEVHGGGAQLTISPRSSFTARVVEACPARVHRHDVVRRTTIVPVWYLDASGWTTSRDRTFTRMRVTGRCQGGEKTFDHGPQETTASARPGESRLARMA